MFVVRIKEPQVYDFPRSFGKKTATLPKQQTLIFIVYAVYGRKTYRIWQLCPFYEM